MKKFYLGSLLIISIILISFFVSVPKTKAFGIVSPSGAAVFMNLHDEGYTEAGYSLYFNGTDGGINGDQRYAVAYNKMTGVLTGKAWSPTYGWVVFSGTSVALTGADAGQVKGTATVPSLQNPNDTESTEWADGNISFLGVQGGSTNPVGVPPGKLLKQAYGVKFNLTTGEVDPGWDHFAWGGNEIGWIDFSGVSLMVEPDCPEGQGTDKNGVSCCSSEIDSNNCCLGDNGAGCGGPTLYSHSSCSDNKCVNTIDSNPPDSNTCGASCPDPWYTHNSCDGNKCVSKTDKKPPSTDTCDASCPDLWYTHNSCSGNKCVSKRDQNPPNTDTCDASCPIRSNIPKYIEN